MARIIGIDLGTTYSAVSIWDDKQKAPVIIPNLEGSRTTPSVVSVNDAGEIIVGEEAKRNLWAAPEDTISQIKREMGRDFSVTMRGQVYNPQTISAYILRYLKMCAEQYLGEPIHDAVITVPAYFEEMQRAATRDAALIAGLNVARLINEPTAAAIAYGVTQVAEGEETVYAVYDLGGGTFDVSIIEVTPEDVSVVGTGGDPRLGGLDMDEAIMKWAVREIRDKYGADLNNDEGAKRRLKVEAEGIKKALVASETATLNVPFLTVLEGKPLSVKLQIERRRFDMLIRPLLTRSISRLEEAVESAEQHNHKGWEDLDGALLVGGPTRLRVIREMLAETLKKHCPSKELEIRCNINPDEVVAMGAAIVAAKCTPIGLPPEQVEQMTPVQVDQARSEVGTATDAPEVAIYDVTGHSLGIALEGMKFHKIIEKETVIPYTGTHGPFSNMADYTTELLVEVYQGENEYVAANTRIGEVRITGLDPLPSGHQMLQVEFHLDISGTLSTRCTDLRTKKTYEGTFTFDGITRMSADEIRTMRAAMSQLAGADVEAAPAASPNGGISQPTPTPATATPTIDLPALPLEQIPEDWRDYWLEGQERLPSLDPARKAELTKAMTAFANAVAVGNPNAIEDKAFLLQDVLLEVQA